MKFTSRSFFYLLLSCSVCSTAFAQQKVTTYFEEPLYTKIENKKGEKETVLVRKKLIKEEYFIKKDSVKHGKYRAYYFKTFDLHLECEYVNGKIEGELREYYPVTGEDGKPPVKKITEYVNNVPHGSNREYYLSGDLKTEYTFTEGIITGEVKEYFEDGSLSMRAAYTAGQPDSVLTYYPTGAVSTRLAYAEGLAQGKATYYFETGELWQIKDFDKGKLHGTVLLYRKDGSVAKSSEFKNDAQDGLTLVYNTTGAVVEEINYKKGIKNGFHKAYYDDGTLKMESIYKKNQMTDSIVYYYPNAVAEKKWYINHDTVRFYSYYNSGKIQTEGTLCQGKLHGQNLGYYESATPAHKYEYVLGEKTGLNEDFFENGRYKKTETISKLKSSAVEYYPSGKTKVKSFSAKQPIKREKIKEFDASGRLKSKSTVLMARKKMINYDLKGRVVSKQFFVNNKPVKTVNYFYPLPPINF